MEAECPRLILWTGPKHSGKTTAAAGLVDLARKTGFAIGGFLAPAVYDRGKLIGFDVLDLHTDSRSPLGRRGANAAERTGEFGFSPEGLSCGHDALARPETLEADLVVIDEFGPLELGGGGWRQDVEMLLVTAKGTILLVVRKELLGRVQSLYADSGPTTIAAGEPDAAQAVVGLLQARRRT